MDSGAHKLLESATHRTLHAHNFSRSSSQASLVLTDLLSRYLHLLSSTCARYAEHAGRRRFNASDAVLALDELGVSIEELKEFTSTEGIDLSRYALKSTRRAEDLAEFQAQLHDGLRDDNDDSIALEYAPLPDDYIGEDEDDEEDAEAESNEPENDDNDVEMASVGQKRQQSPLSSPHSPKRPRTAGWDPLPHIPDFLPPFPRPVDALPSASTPHSPRIPDHPLDPAAENPAMAAVSLPTQDITAATSSAASDFLVPTPYSDSSLSSVPEWHLPSVPRLEPQTNSQRWPTPSIELSLLGAYRSVLQTDIQSNTQANPSRHKVAMALLNLTQTQTRWDTPDTLYSNVASNQPRVPPIGPTFPLPLGDTPERDKDKKDVKLPQTSSQVVVGKDRLSLTVAQQGSRLPELARHILVPNVLHRTTHLTHPPVLMRGTKQLIYGSGVPAPWNANHIPPANDPAAKDGAGGGVNIVIKNDPASKALYPDARLFATWEYESKDFRQPLPNQVKKGKMAMTSGLGLGARGRAAAASTK